MRKTKTNLKRYMDRTLIAALFTRDKMWKQLVFTIRSMDKEWNG